MTTAATTTAGTWGIQPGVRRVIRNSVLELRTALEDDFRRQLAALGIREAGIQALQAGRTLPDADARVREVAAAVIHHAVAGGARHSEAFEAYIRESAYTFLNRMVGLRCLDERGLLIVDGQPETAIKRDPSRNASSLYWRVRNELPPATNPREVWRETLRRAGQAVSQRVRVLFEPEAEHAVLLPLQSTIQKIVDLQNAPEIPPETYAEDELLGWVYQYYNAADKDAVYARLGKGGKIQRPEELAAASCLYTERYMVDYLLQNTLGAVWVEMHPETALPSSWSYYVRPPEGNPRSERAQRRVRDITLLDPACGSGHFLVRAFDLFVQLYRDEGIETDEEIPVLILERNLHGIDIDPRSVQIAALALYLKGCALAGPEFRPRRLNLVSTDVMLPGAEPPADYLSSFRGDLELQAVIKGIWHGLANAAEFGSLLHPERAIDDVVKLRRERDRGGLFEQGSAEWDRWKADLLTGLREVFEHQTRSRDLGQRLFGEEAVKGITLVEALGKRYDIVVMNPPYAGRGNLGTKLKTLLDSSYSLGKRDMYAAFIERGREFCEDGGYLGILTRQSWMFSSSYLGFRDHLLRTTTVTTLAHLGAGAFEEISGEVVSVVMFTLKCAVPSVHRRIAAFRLDRPKEYLQKADRFRQSIAAPSSSLRSSPHQTDFLQRSS